MSKDKGYIRKVLFQDDVCEVINIKWPPGSKSLPHDHGISGGIVSVTCGSVFEKLYDIETKEFIGHGIYNPGEQIQEFPDFIHIMGNNSKNEWAETEHVYMPPLQMKIYQEADLLD